MELHLQRRYHATGTNGELWLDDKLLCFTIELPWRDNSRGRSCIPEGKYRLETRYSPRFNDHLQVVQVPGRTLILLHPANDAVRELKGCIAPVSELTGPGRGMGSRVAFQKVKKRAYDAIRSGERVWLVIGSSTAK